MEQTEGSESDASGQTKSSRGRMFLAQHGKSRGDRAVDKHAGHAGKRGVPLVSSAGAAATSVDAGRLRFAFAKPTETPRFELLIMVLF